MDHQRLPNPRVCSGLGVPGGSCTIEAQFEEPPRCAVALLITGGQGENAPKQVLAPCAPEPVQDGRARQRRACRPGARLDLAARTE